MMKEPALIKNHIQFLRSLFLTNETKCVICSMNLKTYSALRLCKTCTDVIPWINKTICPKCGRFEVCYDCVRRSAVYFVYNRSAVEYNDTMREWLALYKYRGNERMLNLFIEMIDYAYQMLLTKLEIQVNHVGYLTYVPLSEQRLQERGFNQAEQFARGLGRKYKIPVISLLDRTKHTEKQSVGSWSERFSNIQGAFTLNKMVVQRVNKKPPLNIIIIDDVYTTGSTLNECARVITSFLPAKVYGVTWAR
ncbi:ComF family protein [Chengkuizengella axinellae]|uniref:ComF family protein n=1 Tax=Chengkuizengella axinellae TaxID=3064388 RepID=A0ABT9J2P8_9BACL|nr:ComF family protein [Chengkuizengella sp. 2205SS18-9]MDP5275873.1 ComF family protein [Chengkuizengella sp. 2205SS18-9]